MLLAPNQSRVSLVLLDVNTFYAEQTKLETRRLGNLAITAPWLERMNVRKIIDQHLPCDENLEFSYGTIIEILVAARLYGPTPLSGIEAWAAESGADLLYRVPSEKMNDDRFARALDQFFEQRHSILAALSLHVSEEFEIPLDKLHYDPTHLYFTGEYESSQPRDHRAVEYDDQQKMIVHSDGQLPPVHITKGKPVEDAAMGCRMIHLGLGTFVDDLGPVPLTVHAMDGNENGRSGIEEHLGLVVKHLKPKTLLSVSDRGTFSTGHLVRSRSYGFHMICSVPWGNVKNIFDEHFESLEWEQASYLSIEQERRRACESSLPLEHYEIVPLPHTFHDSKSGESVDCRIVFVYSTADAKVTAKQRAKQLAKIEMELKKCQCNIQRRGSHSTPGDVSRRMARVLSNASLAKHISWKMVELDKQQQKQKAVEGRGNRPPTHEFRYSIDRTAIEQDATYDGYSAIVTTLPASEKSADEIFSELKKQIYSEVANGTLKDPKRLAVRPVFLHTPERIEALSFAMVIALMAHYLIQREYRKSAASDPDATNAEKRVTTEIIFRAFRSYSIVVDQNENQRFIYPTRLNEKQQHIMRRIQAPTPANFLRKKIKPQP
jgi:transposase